MSTTIFLSNMYIYIYHINKRIYIYIYHVYWYIYIYKMWHMIWYIYIYMYMWISRFNQLGLDTATKRKAATHPMATCTQCKCRQVNQAPALDIPTTFFLMNRWGYWWGVTAKFNFSIFWGSYYTNVTQFLYRESRK